MDSLDQVFFWRQIKLNRKNGYVFVKGERYRLWIEGALFKCRAVSFEELSDIRHNDIPVDLRFGLRFAWQLGVNKPKSSLELQVSRSSVRASLEVRDWSSPVRLDHFLGRMERGAKDFLSVALEKESSRLTNIVLTAQTNPGDTVSGTANRIFSFLRGETLWLKQEEEKAYKNLEQTLQQIKLNLDLFQQSPESVAGMLSMVMRDLNSEDAALLFALTMPEWASSWITGHVKGDKVRSHDILRCLGLAFFDSSTRAWKATRLGIDALELLMAGQDYKKRTKTPRIQGLVNANARLRGLECLAYVALRSEQYGLSLSRLTRPHESRRRLGKALESLTFADIAALALLDRGLALGEEYDGKSHLVSNGFISKNFKLRRYGVWIVRAIRSYLKKKGLNPLGYTDKDWQYTWGLQPIILEPLKSRSPRPQVDLKTGVLKLKIKTH